MIASACDEEESAELFDMTGVVSSQTGSSLNSPKTSTHFCAEMESMWNRFAVAKSKNMLRRISLSCPAVEPVKASVRRRFSQMSAVRARWRIAEQGPAD